MLYIYIYIFLPSKLRPPEEDLFTSRNIGNLKLLVVLLSPMICYIYIYLCCSSICDNFGFFAFQVFAYSDNFEFSPYNHFSQEAIWPTFLKTITFDLSSFTSRPIKLFLLFPTEQSTGFANNTVSEAKIISSANIRIQISTRSGVNWIPYLLIRRKKNRAAYITLLQTPGANAGIRSLPGRTLSFSTLYIQVIARYIFSTYVIFNSQ